MTDTIQQRACELAAFIIEHGATVRAAAGHFGISKSTVHKDLQQRLPEFNHGLYLQVRQILEQNETSTDPTYKLKRQARLFAVAALLAEYFSHPLAVEETKLQRSDMTRLEPVLDYIQLNHAQELPLDDAADMMGLNKEYFCRLFKKNMGVSYLQYVYQVRTTAFCRELETTEDPISEIAERHGFKDPKMLNQYFREIYGCTPSEKRKFFREVTIDDSDDGEDLPEE